jgi:hypothetical protein
MFASHHTIPQVSARRRVIFPDDREATLKALAPLWQAILPRVQKVIETARFRQEAAQFQQTLDMDHAHEPPSVESPREGTGHVIVTQVAAPEDGHQGAKEAWT